MLVKATRKGSCAISDRKFGNPFPGVACPKGNVSRKFDDLAKGTSKRNTGRAILLILAAYDKM